MSTTVLPPEFADLETFADWSLETEAERYAKRLASTLDEMQVFYDAAFPRLEAAMAHLDALPLDGLPEDATRLLWLCYSLVNALVPGGGVAPTARPRQRRRQHGHGRGAGRLTAAAQLWLFPGEKDLLPVKR